MTRQRGFSLVSAIFILVVVSLLSAYMVKINAGQQTSSALSLQNARAYQAARAGISWAIARLNNGGNCSDVNAQTALTFPDINKFTVGLNCTVKTYREGNQNVTIYLIGALSEFGSFTDQTYNARELEVSVVF